MALLVRLADIVLQFSDFLFVLLQNLLIEGLLLVNLNQNVLEVATLFAQLLPTAQHTAKFLHNNLFFLTILLAEPHDVLPLLGVGDVVLVELQLQPVFGKVLE